MKSDWPINWHYWSHLHVNKINKLKPKLASYECDMLSTDEKSILAFLLHKALTWYTTTFTGKYKYEKRETKREKKYHDICW